MYACNDSGNTDSTEDFERISLYGRTPGEVLYVRVWSYENSFGTFNICAEEIPALGEDDLIQEGISIYPNPAKDRIFIESIKSIDKGVEIKLHDLSGKEVFVKNRLEGFDVSKFAPGVYILTVRYDGKFFSKKMIVE